MYGENEIACSYNSGHLLIDLIPFSWPSVPSQNTVPGIGVEDSGWVVELDGGAFSTSVSSHINMFLRHNGQSSCSFNHSLMHSSWNTWLQHLCDLGQASFSSWSYPDRHMLHSGFANVKDLAASNVFTHARVKTFPSSSTEPLDRAEIKFRASSSFSTSATQRLFSISFFLSTTCDICALNEADCCPMK